MIIISITKEFSKTVRFCKFDYRKYDCQNEMSELWGHYILLPMKYDILLLIPGITWSPRDFYFVKVKINLKHDFIYTCENELSHLLKRKCYFYIFPVELFYFLKENVNNTNGEHIFYLLCISPDHLLLF